MSLDGCVADRGDGVAEVFDWYTAGDVVVPTGTSEMTFHVSAPSAAHLRGLIGEVGAMLTGRRTFEKAGGWSGQHPWGPAFVLTHDVPEGWPRPGSTVHFVTDGLESAVAQAAAAAGERAVGVHGGDTIRQCLDAGLLEEIYIDLVPGDGGFEVVIGEPGVDPGGVQRGAAEELGHGDDVSAGRMSSMANEWRSTCGVTLHPGVP